MFKPIEKKDFIKAVSKAQSIRLIDIFFLGPLMIYLPFKYKMKPLDKFLLSFFGATTIYYNAENYIINKKRGF